MLIELTTKQQLVPQEVHRRALWKHLARLRKVLFPHLFVSQFPNQIDSYSSTKHVICNPFTEKSPSQGVGLQAGPRVDSCSLIRALFPGQGCGLAQGKYWKSTPFATGYEMCSYSGRLWEKERFAALNHWHFIQLI